MREDKHYEVRNVAKENALVCFSLDRARPDSYMDALEDELRRASYRGDVVLDLLAANGDNHRRFMRMPFDGAKLHWLQARIAKLDTISSELLRFCNGFYLKHPEVIENSALSSDARTKFTGDNSLA